MIVYTISTLYMFLGIAVICDDYFCPSLEVISAKLKLSEQARTGEPVCSGCLPVDARHILLARAVVVVVAAVPAACRSSWDARARMRSNFHAGALLLLRLLLVTTTMM